jgi:hypothetical protein
VEIPRETLDGIPALPRWKGSVPLRHRDGYRVKVGLLAHHRVERDHNPGSSLVCLLTDTATEPADETPAAWSFEQSPCCAMAVYDTDLRLRPELDQVERAIARVL